MSNRRCASCHGAQWGLVRQYVLTWSGWLHFCSFKCKADFVRHREQETQRRKAVHALFQFGTTRVVSSLAAHIGLAQCQAAASEALARLLTLIGRAGSTSAKQLWR